MSETVARAEYDRLRAAEEDFADPVVQTRYRFGHVIVREKAGGLSAPLDVLTMPSCFMQFAERRLGPGSRMTLH